MQEPTMLLLALVVLSSVLLVVATVYPLGLLALPPCVLGIATVLKEMRRNAYAFRSAH